MKKVALQVGISLSQQTPHDVPTPPTLESSTKIKKGFILFPLCYVSKSSSSDFFGLDIIACSDVHWSAHLLVGLPGSLRPRGL
jgi:hypothetical protein